MANMGREIPPRMGVTKPAPRLNVQVLSEAVLAMVQGKADPGNIVTTFQLRHEFARCPELRGKLLCAAVKYDHLELLRFLLETGFGAFKCDSCYRYRGQGETLCPLHLAVESDKAEAVDVLLQHEYPDLVKQESIKSPPWLRKCNMADLLKIVIRQDNCDVLAKLVPHCDPQTDYYRSLIRNTCRLNARACFEYLLNHPEIVDTETVEGQYSLFYVVVHEDSLYFTQRLVQRGLEPISSSCDKTIFHGLRCRSDDSITILKTLLNTRTNDLLVEGFNGHTALDSFIGRLRSFLNLELLPKKYNWLEHCLSQIRRFLEMVRIFLENDAAELASKALPTALANFWDCTPECPHDVVEQTRKASLRGCIMRYLVTACRPKNDDDMNRYCRVLPEIFAVCYDTVRLLLAKGVKPSPFKASTRFPMELRPSLPPLVGHVPMDAGIPMCTAPGVIIKAMTTERWTKFRLFPEDTVDLVTAQMEAVFRLLLNHGATGVELSTFVRFLTQDPDRYLCFLDLYLDSLPLPEQRSYMEGLQSELEKKPLKVAQVPGEEVLEVLKPQQKALQERLEVCLTLKYICRCQLLQSARVERQQFVKALPLPESLKDYVLGVKSARI